MMSLRDVLVDLVRRKRAAYLRELQVSLEDDFKHWEVTNTLKTLVPSELARKRFRDQTWYFDRGVEWDAVRPLVDKKADLVNTYAQHSRSGRFQHGGIQYMDYSEYLVEGALLQAGYIVVAKDARYFNGRMYTKPSLEPGRPPDLDYVALVPERDIPVGVSIKNHLGYPEEEFIDSFLEMCRVLDVRPLLVVRMAPEDVLKRVVGQSGRVIVFKRWLLAPGLPRDVFDSIADVSPSSLLGLPVSIYNYVPAFLVKKFTDAKEAFVA